jgi:hypothetical protein
MKYKVKNTVTGEETICEKVVVDNYDYYLSKNPELDDYCYNPRTKEFFRVLDTMMIDGLNKNNDDYKVIATTNKSLDLPMVIDEVEENYYKELEERREVAKNFKGQVAGSHPDFFGNSEIHNMVRGYLEGFKKAKETYSFTKEDLINFKQQAPLILEQLNGASDSELFAIWQEQRTVEILVK